MDDLNSPLGLDNKTGNGARSLIQPRILLSLVLLVAGLAMAWIYFPGSTENDPTQKSAAVDTEAAGGTLDLRTEDKPPVKPLTESDPDQPARLDDLEPQGELQEPRITFLNPTAQGPLSLSYLPNTTMLENSSLGKLPKISNSGRRPIDAYARPVSSQGSARIAIIVGGMGLSQSGSKSAIEQLPGQITLAFAPYGNSISRWMKKARKDGHELLMQVPMEPIGYPEINPGKRTLVSGSPVGTNLENLHWSMARMTNYVGIMNYLGARMQSDQEAMAPILGEINQRGLLYLDDGSTFSSKTKAVANAIGVPFARGDMIIDADRSAKAIQNNLLALEKLARRNGRAIGVASAFPRTVQQISRWVEQAEKRGIDIVPISALVK